jgi:replicative DNA helicase
MAISIYSTACDHEECGERLAIQKTKIDRYKKDFTSEELKQLEEAREEVSQKTVYYRHDNFIGIDEIVEKSIEIDKSLGAVVVDYYQGIQGNTHEKCLKLKELSRKLGCPVLVLSTVLESADKREEKRPIPEDLKDYGEIKDNFDKLIIVSQDPKMSLSNSKKIANLDVYSHTRNSHNHIHLVWDGSYCGYSESL